MGVEVVEDWWVSLRMRPLKELMVEFAVNAILGDVISGVLIWLGLYGLGMGWFGCR